MAISPRCDRCKKELDKFGAILLSPPDDESMSEKIHLCTDCFDEIRASF